MNAVFNQKINDVLIFIQTILFVFLFAVWILPETILIRHLCLALGAMIGAYQIYMARSFLFSKMASSIWLLVMLFIWIGLHLIFFSNNFELQYAEFTSTWKRVFLGFIFALGFGLGFSSVSEKTQKNIWPIFFLGLMSPTLIYIVKYSLNFIYQSRGLTLPEYLQLFTTGSSKFYVAKTAYVGFCIPVFSAALGQIYLLFRRNKLGINSGLVYFLTLPLVLFVFYVENIKNGMVYALAMFVIFFALIVVRSIKVSPIKTIVLMVLTVLIVAGFFLKHIEHRQNESWKTLWVDAKVAVQTTKYENWKCGAKLGYPLNELGQTVSITNYERIAWGLNAVQLITQYPLGYGLVEQSFGRRGQTLWPNSCLNQSHSGWLDLTLGIGIPGIVLLLGSLLLGLRNLIPQMMQNLEIQRWSAMLFWVNLSFLLLWCTTEISQKVFLDELIFFLAIAGGFVASSCGVSGRAQLMPQKGDLS